MPSQPTLAASEQPPDNDDWPLSPDEYLRYGRQMIMPDWGLEGQLKLKSSRVAVVGAGGLGCPLLQYLAGAGVGSITIFDHDTVAASNLHRQVLHITERVGMNKALSACVTLKALNPHVELIPRAEALTPSTAIDQLSGHDIVVDCTDRPYTRYLISDATVLLAIPLVSGAAIGAAGQWAVYGQPGRACYRCLWPQPGASQRCDEAGVWGPVTGMVGCAMAAEALRVLVGSGDAPLLHILHLGGSPAVRSVKMRPPSPKCAACGPNKTIASLEDVDYAMFCGEVATDESTGTAPGGVGERIGVEELKGVLAAPTDDTVVVDTRPPVEYRICALRNTTSESSRLQPRATGLTFADIPLATILRTPEAVPSAANVIFLCRRGNDSQIAAAKLRTVRDDVRVTDVLGGLLAWTRRVDPKFPTY